jgi:integrase/recombinase XerC
MEESTFMKRLRERLAEEDLAAETVKRTMIDARQFEGWYRGTAGHDLNPDDLQVVAVDLSEFRGWLQRQDMKPSSVQRKFASLRKAFMLLSPERALRLRWPKLPQTQVTAPSGLSRNERNAILRACEQMSARDALIVKLGMFTAARSSSVASIRLSDIEFGQRSGSIVYHGKGNREYKVPMNREVREALTKYLAERPPVAHDYLLVQERWPYERLSRWVLHDIVHRRLTRHLPPDVAKRMKGLHAFRHDLARRLLSGDEGRHAPIPVGDVAAILGHADVRTTAGIYARPSPEDMKRALDRIAGDEEEGDG